MHNPEMKVQKNVQTISEKIMNCIKKLNQILTQVIGAHLKAYVTDQVKKNRSSKYRNDSIHNEKGSSKP